MDAIQAESGVVLVIDRDPITLIGTAAVLHHYGYESVCARDLAAAGKALERYSFDLVVMDLGRNTDESVATVQNLRSTSNNPELPLLLIADPQWAGLEKQVESLDHVRCLFKPIDPRVLGDLAQQMQWLPFVAAGARSRGGRPKARRVTPPGWVSL